jgi:hypothetical protein
MLHAPAGQAGVRLTHASVSCLVLVSYMWLCCSTPPPPRAAPCLQVMCLLQRLKPGISRVSCPGCRCVASLAGHLSCV